jgi:hypothetical protein
MFQFVCCVALLQALGVTAWAGDVVRPRRAETGYVIVVAAAAEVREGPSTTYAVIDTVERDDVFPKLGRTGRWYYVQIDEETFGWISGRALSRYWGEDQQYDQGTPPSYGGYYRDYWYPYPPLPPPALYWDWYFEYPGPRGYYYYYDRDRGRDRYWDRGPGPDRDGGRDRTPQRGPDRGPERGRQGEPERNPRDLRPGGGESRPGNVGPTPGIMPPRK